VRRIRYIWRWGDEEQYVTSENNVVGVVKTLPATYIELYDLKSGMVIAMCGDAATAERITDALNRTEPQ